MELHFYFKVVRRWWWLILLPAAAAGMMALATYHPSPTAFTTSVRFTAGQPESLPGAAPGYDPNYYRWLTSEYIVNGLADWVKTGSFAASVSQALAGRGVNAPPAAVQGALAADHARSLLVIYLTWPDPQGLRALTESVAEALQTRSAQAFPQFGGQPPQIVPLDDPASVGLGPVGPGLRDRLEVPLKVGLGLALGLALAFAAHALDPRVREREDVEGIGLEVVGEIPSPLRKKEEGRRKEEEGRRKEEEGRRKEEGGSAGSSPVTG